MQQSCKNKPNGVEVSRSPYHLFAPLVHYLLSPKEDVKKKRYGVVHRLMCIRDASKVNTYGGIGLCYMVHHCISDATSAPQLQRSGIKLCIGPALPVPYGRIGCIVRFLQSKSTPQGAKREFGLFFTPHTVWHALTVFVFFAASFMCYTFSLVKRSVFHSLITSKM